VVEAGGFTRTLAIAMVIAGLALAGCSSKKNANEGS
jgi:outer membrane murein-binding lipoprotein Lpp